MKLIIDGIKELYLLADADFYFCRQGGPPMRWRKSYKKKRTTTTRVAGVTHNITTHTSVKNARCSICLKIACIFFKISQTFKCLDLHCLRQKTVAQSDKGLAKIAECVSPRRHAETSPVKVKDTHLMNNKLPPAEILCGHWAKHNKVRT